MMSAIISSSMRSEPLSISRWLRAGSYEGQRYMEPASRAATAQERSFGPGSVARCFRVASLVKNDGSHRSEPR